MAKVLIVGAGPAGLFAAQKLADSCDVTIIEQKSYIGGAGLYSDGKMNFHPQIGGNLLEFLSEENAFKILEEIKQTFKECGMKEVENDWEKLIELERRATTAGIKFIPIRQNHVGSDYLPKVMNNFKTNLEKKGVKFKLNTKVLDLDSKNGKIIVKTDKGNEEANYIILAPGRVGSLWLIEMAKKLGLGMRFSPVDIGVRVEVLNDVMKEIIHDYQCWDPKFHIRTQHYDDDVRTFCVCPYGFVVKEFYEEDIFGVNGHSMKDKKSNNCNFALLIRTELTQPLENTTEYGRSIARQTNTLGGSKPIIQRVRDLRMSRRSTWERIGKSYVEPTLKDVTPGDISMAYPYRIVINVLEALDKLEKVIPGVGSDSTLLYAPEIKFYSMRIETNKILQTAIPNIFVAGDGAGVSRGITIAAATGMIAANGIKNLIK
nr:FAD-dependent oxidoreductase [Nanoarchaeum sp.]